MGVHVPLVTLSVDLELEIEQQRPGAERQLEQTTAELIGVFDRHRAAATWAVADPAISAAMHQIRRSQLPHEVAIQGDRSWVGHGAGRTRFARELTRRVLSARAAGIPVSTLALKNADLGEHLDLLVKSGISVVRGGQVAADANGRQSRMLRFGVWEAPVSARLPEVARWSWSAGLWSAKRLVRQAMKKNLATHLSIDASRLMGPDTARLVTIEKFLKFAARLRDQGRLQIAPLRALAGDGSSSVGRPMQSILRAA